MRRDKIKMFRELDISEAAKEFNVAENKVREYLNQHTTIIYEDATTVVFYNFQA